MCHKLVALHVWTHTGGRFRGASGSIFLAIVCGNYFAVCGTIASTCCTRRAAPKKILKMLKVGRSETTKVVKVALSPDPIKSVKAPEAPET